jgi:UDP-2,4-diacetamido-2,4,6-trideoxy-beta-L-altropyranose hydrolase
LRKPLITYQVMQDDVTHAPWVGVPWEQDVEETALTISAFRPDWLIVDHYGIDARWQKALRDQVGQIMAIDDLADRPLDCNLLLDQTYGRKEEDYKPWVPPGCQTLLGSQYALLQPRFAELRTRAIEKRRTFNDINRILVSMGGGDTVTAIATVLEGLSCVNWHCKPVIDVVLGHNASHIQQVVAQVESSALEIMVSADISDMAERMLVADLSIGAGGATSWERCCLGLPTLMISLAENQALIAYEVEKAGASIHLGSIGELTVKSVKSSLQMLNDNGDLMRDLASKGFQLVDGIGTKRVAQCMDSRL